MSSLSAARRMELTPEILREMKERIRNWISLLDGSSPVSKKPMQYTWMHSLPLHQLVDYGWHEFGLTGGFTQVEQHMHWSFILEFLNSEYPEAQ